jgi:hypothetical protein
MGSLEIDFASAPAPPEVQVFAVSILGSAKVMVRTDQEVKLSGFSLMGRRQVDPIQPGGDDFQLPLEVTAFSLMGSVDLKREDRAED